MEGRKCQAKQFEFFYYKKWEPLEIGGIIKALSLEDRCGNCMGKDRSNKYLKERSHIQQEES